MTLLTGQPENCKRIEELINIVSTDSIRRIYEHLKCYDWAETDWDIEMTCRIIQAQTHENITI